MNRAEKVSAVLTVAFGIFVMAYSYYSLKLGMMIMPGAGFLPFYIGVAMVVLGAVWLVQRSVRGKETCVPIVKDPCIVTEIPPEQVDRIAGLPRKMLLGLLALIVYATLFERIGYFLATLIFMFAWQMVVERESLLKSFLITGIATVAMYTLFSYLLNVHLPKGQWF